MKLLFLSKYPPIQGGESAKAYWLAKGLGERGHSISVVSNCLEVEEMYRSKLDDKDMEILQPKRVKLHSTVPIKVPKFIPQTNPYSEKLVSLALGVVEDINPDLIFSWYLLPYGVTAHITSKLTGVKYTIKHAGSDITRLYHDPQLHNFLKRVIVDANFVFTNFRMKNFFEELGCKNVLISPRGISNEFNPYGEITNLKEEYNLDIDSGKTFLFLGKISKPKGIGYLVDAISEIKTESHLLIAGDGPYKESCKRKISESGLEDKIHFLGTLPPWKIPPLIRAVKSVIIPEYNFGVPIHQSSIPYEALLCAKTPIISKEIAFKYGELSDYFINVDPVDMNNFAKTLEGVLENEDMNNILIRDYPKIREIVGDFNKYVEKMEDLLIKAIS